MKKQYSRIGFVGSLCIHSAVFAGLWWTAYQTTPIKKATDEATNISMEMMTAILEQPSVAIAPPEPELIPEPEPEPEPEIVPEPAPKPEEKPKPVKKPKPPKKKNKPIVKAVEKGKEIKEGVATKLIEGAQQTNRLQIGESGNATVSQANEVNAYKARLQRTLQKQANNAYPKREQMLRKTGVVTISFHISPEGKITNISIVQSSGNSNLDAAAIQAAKNVDMKTAPPAGFPDSLKVPIKFSIL